MAIGVGIGIGLDGGWVAPLPSDGSLPTNALTLGAFPLVIGAFYLTLGA